MNAAEGMVGLSRRAIFSRVVAMTLRERRAMVTAFGALEDDDGRWTPEAEEAECDAFDAATYCDARDGYREEADVLRKGLRDATDRRGRRAAWRELKRTLKKLYLVEVILRDESADEN
jgi:hypothetical protein